MLDVRDLSVSYGGIQALTGANFEVRKGEFIAILGPNGAGKSTLIKAVMGTVALKSGRIQFENADLSSMVTAERIRRGIGIIPEGRQLFPDMTAQENLILGAYSKLGVFVPSNLSSTLDEIFTIFPRLGERRHQLAGTFSGGEAQMLAIGRALVSKPQLLLCDEPSLGLAPALVQEMLATLSSMQRDYGITIVLADQNAAAALRMADRAYVLDSGRVVASGPANVLQKDKRLHDTYLGTGLD